VLSLADPGPAAPPLCTDIASTPRLAWRSKLVDRRLSDAADDSRSQLTLHDMTQCRYHAAAERGGRNTYLQIVARLTPGTLWSIDSKKN